MDKDVMSLIKHILTTKKLLRIWNLFYPLKANYLKTFSHALEPFLFNPTGESSLEMINNIKVQDSRECFIQSMRIELDIDRQYSYVDFPLVEKSGKLH